MALEINCCFRHMGDTMLLLLPEREIPMACALLEALQNGMLKSICLRTDELPEERFGLQGRPVMCWPSNAGLPGLAGPQPVPDAERHVVPAAFAAGGARPTGGAEGVAGVSPSAGEPAGRVRGRWMRIGCR